MAPQVTGGTSVLPAARRPGPPARVRRAAATAPGRLRTASAVLVVLALLFGGAALWQSADRASAAGRLVSRSGPLSEDAAEIYRSLADADATAATGFLLAGNEPAEVRQRYQDDLATASRLIAEAAASGGSASAAQHSLAALNQQLPRYAGLVETARAINREGLPLGGAYLRYASDLMQKTILPNAQQLVDAEAAELDADYDAAAAVPWPALLLGALALAALLACQWRLFRRTNRVFNPGLVAASLAVLVALGWVVGGTVSGGLSLEQARTRGIHPLRQLNTVRVEALQAHTAEILNTVSRGSTDTYDKQWTKLSGLLNSPDDRTPGSVRSLLREPTDATRAPLGEAAGAFGTWQERHDEAAGYDRDGDYDKALRTTLTGPDSADAAFRTADLQWSRAAGTERDAFASAAAGVDGVLVVQAVAAALLAAVAAGAAVRGIDRRLAEYR